MKALASFVFLGAFAALVTLARPAAAVGSCGGVSDQDCNHCGASNPFPCCSNDGNCTWWAWQAACCNWGIDVPMRHNANTWVGDAQGDSRFDVRSTPEVGSIACRTTGTWGHVAYVTAVNGAKIEVDEENCDYGPGGVIHKTYDASYFDGGYIVYLELSPKCSGGAKPGETKTEACGNCGSQSYVCDDQGDWQTSGGCTGEGECAKGSTGTKPCQGTGTQTRTCQDNCTWGAYGACVGGQDGGTTDGGAGKDGGGGTGGGGGQATGGAAGHAPDGAVLADGAVVKPDANGGQGGTFILEDDYPGCGCRTSTGSTSAGWLAIMGLTAAALRRRRRR